jgi:hypothetical protein
MHIRGAEIAGHIVADVMFLKSENLTRVIQPQEGRTRQAALQSSSSSL